MNKEEFESRHLKEGGMVLYEGKPVRVMSAGRAGVTVCLGVRHYKTVLYAELEVVDGYGVETR